MSKVLRRSLQTTLFTTALTATSTLTGPAMAYTINSNVMDLAPLSPWSVSQGGAKGAQAYCTLSKQYKKNIILTLAENSAQNLTFALDFQKDKFETDSTYNITISTDNGDSRVYELSPSTNKAFIIRIKEDLDFYKNLWGSHALTVSVNTENYRFNTIDLMEGRGQIDPCLASLKPIQKKGEPKQEPHQQAEVHNVPVEVTEESIKSKSALSIPRVSTAVALNNAPVTQTPGFEAIRISLAQPESAEHIEIQTDNTSSVLSSQRAVKQETIATEEIATAPQTDQPLPANIAVLLEELNGKIDALENENQALHTHLENMSVQIRSMEKAANKVMDVIHENKDLKAENIALKSALTSQKAAAKALEIEVNSLRNTAQPSERAVQNISADAQDSAEKTQQEIKTLRTENANLKKHLKNASSVKQENLSREFDSLRQEIQDLRSEMKTSQTGPAIMLKTRVALETERHEAPRRFAMIEPVLEEASNDDEITRTEYQTLKKRFEEQEALIKSLANQLQNNPEATEKSLGLLRVPASQVTENRNDPLVLKMQEQLRTVNQALEAEKRRYVTLSGNADTTYLPSPSSIAYDDDMGAMEMSEEIERLRKEIERLRQLQVPSANTRIIKAKKTERNIIVSGRGIQDVEDHVISKPIKEGNNITAAPITTDIQQDTDYISSDIQDVNLPDETTQNTETLEAEIPADPLNDGLLENTHIIDADINTLNIPKQKQNNEIEVSIDTLTLSEDEPVVIVSDKDVISSAPTTITVPDAPTETSTHIFQVIPDRNIQTALKAADPDITMQKNEEGILLWISQNIEGTLARKLLGGETFANAVQSILSKMKSECPAKVDVTTLAQKENETARMHVYDVACGNALLGLVFYSNDSQTFTTISYAATAENETEMRNKRQKFIAPLLAQID